MGIGPALPKVRDGTSFTGTANDTSNGCRLTGEAGAQTAAAYVLAGNPERYM